jgi:hypothetical protein
MAFSELHKNLGRLWKQEFSDIDFISYSQPALLFSPTAF